MSRPVRPRAVSLPFRRSGAFVLSLAAGASAQGYLILESSPGAAQGSLFGRSIAGVGDVNGDGAPDFAVGAPGTSGFGTPAGTPGQVQVFSGSDGSLLFVFNGIGANDRLGASVAGIGDLDLDGVPDLAVGAPQAVTIFPGYGGPGAIPPPPLGAGYLRVFSGATGIPLFTVQGTSLGIPGIPSVGGSPGDQFGASVAGVGDADGDGVPDLLVGATQLTYANSPGAGYATLLSGAGGGPLLTLAAGGCPSFGISVAGPGDVDGDGLGDLLVGAAQPYSGWVPNVGCARLHSGASGALLFAFNGTNPGYALGRSVAGCGDVDGDGVPDLLVGVPGVGEARLYSGANGNLLLTMTGGPGISGGVGSVVSGPGDVDGDGWPDLAFSAQPQTLVTSGATGGTLFAIPYPAGSLAGAGDVNGDGRADVLAGPFLVPSGLVAQVFSTTGIPRGSTVFGAGCPGPGGLTPEIGATGGIPDSASGNPAFGIRLWRALGGTTAILIAGVSNQNWGGLNLPLDLTPQGMPGCSLLVSADVLLPTFTSGSGPGAGAAEIPLPVPTSAFLSGGLVHLQWFVAGPGPAPLPGAMSQGLQLLLL